MPAKFQQRHYEAIAQVIKEVNKHYSNCGPLHSLAWRMSDMFQEDNLDFKRALFMAACGVPD